MKYTDFKMNNYNLHVIETKRFKTILYNVNIRFKDDRECAGKCALLSRLLSQTNKNYDTLRDINIACANIYDPTYNIKVIQSGSQNILSLSASFVSEHYTEKGMNEENFKFLTQFIFEPKIINNAFEEKTFNVAKAKLLDYYKTLKDNPRAYADDRITSNMQIKEFKEKSLEEVINSLEKLTSKELYQFYLQIMSEGTLDITVCGDVKPLEIKNIMDKIIDFKGSQNKINHIINQKTYNEKPNIIIEKAHNTQSNLIIGCKLIDLTDFERNYVFILYSWILGGGMNSLLNRTVREKNSLCYYIYASRKNLFGSMNIYAGINGKDFDKTYNLTLKEMENMRQGNFDDDLFNGVKEIYYDSLIKMEDSESDIVNSYNSQIFTNGDDINTKRKNMEKVTKEDVINLAHKVHIDTVYLLKGENNGKKL